MLKFLIFSLFVVTAISAPLEETRVSGDEDVQLVINGDESKIPADFLGIDINKIQDGQVVSEKLFPIEKSPEIIDRPVPLPEIGVQPIVVLPEVLLPGIETRPIILPEINRPVPVPEFPEHPVIILPEVLPEGIETRPIVLPDINRPVPVPVVILPGGETYPVLPGPIVEEPQPEKNIGEVYKDDVVSVTVNAEEGVFSKISSWFSLIINKFTGSSEEKVQVI